MKADKKREKLKKKSQARKDAEAERERRAEEAEQKKAEAVEKQRALQEAEKRAARMKTVLHKAELQNELNRSA